MNPDSLRAGLHDLAEEVRPADLRDRAIHTSHRIARTRLALVAAATAAVIGVTSAGLAMGRDDRALPEIATTPTPSAAPSATLPAGATSAVYVDDLMAGSAVTVWNASGTRRVRMAQPDFDGPEETAIRQTLTVSPDGTLLSWMASAGIRVVPLADAKILDNTTGILLESSNREDPIVYGGCVWSPDSTRLLAGVRNPDASGWIYGWFTLADRSFAPSDTGDLNDGCGGQVNGDWAAALFSPGGNELRTAVWNMRTGERRELLDGKSGVEITGVSPDGSRITARVIDPNPQYPSVPESNRQGDRLIDTRTGETLPVDTGGREIDQLIFTPSGDLVARVYDGDASALMIFAPDGRLISHTVEPATLRDALLLRLVTS